MGPPPKHGVVAVSGAAGFLGGWVVRQLLDKGYRVRATVRDPADPGRTDFLKAMPAFASGRLTLHAADVGEAGAFDAILAGAHAFLHVAHVSDYDDQDYVRRTCERLVASIEAARTVSRVVVTSSIAAIISEADITEVARRPVLDESRFPDEANPRRTPERGQGYSMAKLVAERTFTGAAERSGGAWDTIVVCPGDNVGPIQSAHQKDMGPWQHLIEQMLEGEYPQTFVYRPWMTVDVRDDAACHIALMESAKAKNGERYIAWSAEARDVAEVCATITRVLPELGFHPYRPTDRHNERLQAREAEFRDIWSKARLRNDRMRAATGIAFRPLDDSIRDCVESLLSVARVKPIRAAEKAQA